MTVYRVMSEPLAYRGYAYFVEPSPHGINYTQECGTCGRVIESSRVEVPLFEYQDGVPADFHSGIGHMLVPESTKEILEPEFRELSFAPTTIQKKGKYQIPPQFEIRPRVNIEFDAAYGDFEVSEICPVCGRHFFKFKGVWASDTYAEEDGEMGFKIVPPAVESGLRLPRSILAKARVFSFSTSYLLCVESFKVFCDDRDFKNVMFLPYGTVIEG
jgi:hypothetical protein